MSNQGHMLFGVFIKSINSKCVRDLNISRGFVFDSNIFVSVSGIWISGLTPFR